MVGQGMAYGDGHSWTKYIPTLLESEELSLIAIGSECGSESGSGKAPGAKARLLAPVNNEKVLKGELCPEDCGEIFRVVTVDETELCFAEGTR